MRPTLARLLLTAALLAVSTACTPTIDVRGNAPDPERLAEIKPGVLTRSDVATLLGTPSSTSNFGDDRWYYITSKVQSYAFLAPVELERQVVQIDFDRAGKVAKVTTLGLQDGNQVDIVSRETPSAGRDLGVLEQLLGNVGRFSKSKGPGASP